MFEHAFSSFPFCFEKASLFKGLRPHAAGPLKYGGFEAWWLRGLLGLEVWLEVWAYMVVLKRGSLEACLA